MKQKASLIHVLATRGVSIIPALIYSCFGIIIGSIIIAAFGAVNAAIDLYRNAPFLQFRHSTSFDEGLRAHALPCRSRC